MASSQKRVESPQDALEMPAIPAAAWVLAASPVKLADGAPAVSGSPTRVPQGELTGGFPEREQYQRWSARRSLVTIVGASLLGWIVLIVTARALFW